MTQVAVNIEVRGMFIVRLGMLLITSFQRADLATSLKAELHRVAMKIPDNSALLNLISGKVVIDTQKTGLLKSYSPQTIHHDDGDVKTTNGLKGNIGLSNAKPTLSIEGSIASERQRKGRAINFTSNQCGGAWNHSFEASEDRRVGLLPCKDEHFLEMSYSRRAYDQLLKGKLLFAFKAEL
jgi:hypothetical protein